MVLFRIGPYGRSRPMNSKGFFAELKRRNVIRMAGLYLVGAWLLVQVAGTVLPMFGAPEWLPRSVVILLAIGFLPALIFSWVFEMTPQGLKRDEDVAPEQSIAPQTARRMDRMIIGVLVLALAYFAFDKFVLTPKRDAALGRRPSTPTVERVRSPCCHSSTCPAMPRTILLRRHQRRNPECPGAHTRAGCGAHFVVFLQGKNAGGSRDRRRLNVRMVLEGSVRKQEDRVRITAQLIDARSGFHLWSQTYDRKLQDIFAIQDEIAKDDCRPVAGKAFAAGCEAAIERPRRATSTRSISTRAPKISLSRRLPAVPRKADFLPGHQSPGFQAVARDPSFSKAYCRLAEAHDSLYNVYAIQSRGWP